VRQQLEKHRNRSKKPDGESPGPHDPPAVAGTSSKAKADSARRYLGSSVAQRIIAARKFLAFLSGKGMYTAARPLKLQYGVFSAYVRQTPGLAKTCHDGPSSDRHRKWLLRCLVALDAEPLLAPTGLRSLARGDGKRRYVRDSMRRKIPGHYGLHRVKALVVRERLFEWFSIMRHSLNSKVMTRFPPKLVELKAKQLVQDYVIACLSNEVEPNPPVVNGHWLKTWQMEYRVSFRRPNRKFKVPKHVLESRLSIFWANLARVRALASLLFGYELEAMNIDQTPYHMNEAGGGMMSAN
jgi:hypothetical protein